jgi:hypothetical protein
VIKIVVALTLMVYTILKGQHKENYYLVFQQTTLVHVQIKATIVNFMLAIKRVAHMMVMQSTTYSTLVRSTI